MRLSQSALFLLLCASFSVGLILAFFCDVLYMARLWLMPSGIRYTVPNIQKLRASRIKKETAKKSKSLRVVIFLSEVLLCLVGAILLILLLYWLNNGAFRAVAPLCMIAGFWLWYRFISKSVRILLQWLAFCFETILYALFLPIKRLLHWITKIHKKNAQKRHIARLTKERKTYTKQKLQNIDKAAERLLPIYSKSRMQKGDSRARKSKKAV